MFSVFKERNLSDRDKEIYLWFKARRKKHLTWKINLSKKFNLIFKNDLSEFLVQGRKDKFGTKWQHELYGEISDVNHFWSQLDAIYVLILKALLSKQIIKEKRFIIGKILFLKTAVKNEITHARDEHLKFEKFKRKFDKQFHGEFLLERDKSEAGRISRMYEETNVQFYNLMFLLTHYIKEIEDKLAEFNI